MLLLRVSQAGEPALRTWSQTSLRTPALQGSQLGRRSKEPGRKPGVVAVRPGSKQCPS